MIENLKKISNINYFLKKPKIIKLQKIHGKTFVLENLREGTKKVRLEILNKKIIITKSIINKFVVDFVIKNCKKKNICGLTDVFNGSGVLLHTNLGRAPLSKMAIKAIEKISNGYSNLELNLKTGKRQERDFYVVELLKKLTGCEDAIIVNNNAAAILLVLSALCEGKEAIISKGELLEIGNSFRISEIMLLGKPLLKEIGTTNITNLKDYENAINENTKIIVKVKKSNFLLKGFFNDVNIIDLIKLGKYHNIPIYYDMGSCYLKNMSIYFKKKDITVENLIKKSIDIISFSADKVLGGVQAGIIIGKKKLIEKLKINQLLRALRPDKLILSGLEATLISYLSPENIKNEIPLFIILNQNNKELKEKACFLYEILLKNKNKYSINLKKTFALIGGGAMPNEKIKSFAIVLNFRNEINAIFCYKKLLYEKPNLLTRIKKNKIIIDIIALKKENLKIISNKINLILKEIN